MYIDSRSVQRFLQAKGLYQGPVDGEFGDRSLRGSRIFLEGLADNVSSYKAAWPDARVRIAVEQAMMKDIGADIGMIDGIAGVRTQIGLERWQEHITFVKPPLPDAPPQAGPLIAPEIELAGLLKMMDQILQFGI